MNRNGDRPMRGQSAPYRVGRPTSASTDTVAQAGSRAGTGSSGQIRKLKGGNSTLKERPPAATLLQNSSSNLHNQNLRGALSGIKLSIRVGVKEEVEVQVQPTDTVRDVVSQLASEIGLKDDGRLGLVNAAGQKNLFVNPTHSIQQAMEQIRYFRLSTRLKFGEKTSSSQKWIEEFDFFEATSEVVEGEWDVTRDAAVKLAALHMQITVPDSPMLSRSAHILTEEILETYLRPKWRTSYNIGVDIHREYLSLHGLKKDVAIDQYLETAYSYQGYGEDLFLVTTKAGQGRQSELLAIGGSRVARLHPQTKLAIIEFGYNSIKSIHPSPDFPLDASQFLTLQTEFGQHVMGTNSESEAASFSLLIYDYQTFIQKRVSAMFQQQQQQQQAKPLIQGIIETPIEFDVDRAMDAMEDYVDEVLDENCNIM